MKTATSPRRASRVREKYKAKVHTPKGVIYVYYEEYDIHPTENRWCWHQTGRRVEKGFFVYLERWHVGPKWNDYGEWVEVSRSKDRIRRPPKKVLPEMTDAEKDAWADWAFGYLQRAEVVHTGELSKLIPGWDDVHTFEPGRMPSQVYSGPHLWDRWAVDDNWAPAAQRARALCGMALRRLVQQGRAIKFYGEEAYGLPEEARE